MEKETKGFTLIELIVVIAILAILAAVSIPAFNGLREQSKKRVCYSNQQTLTRAYLAQFAMYSGQNFDLDAFMAEQGLTKEGTDQYKGYCPDEAGVYTVAVDAQKGSIAITCSKHGGGGGTVTSLVGKDVSKILIEALEYSKIDSKYIDSNAVDSENSLADKRFGLESALNQLGFSTEGVTWGINASNKGTPMIYWTEDELSSSQEGQQTVAIRYNSKTATYTVVKVNVIKPSTRDPNGTVGVSYPSDDYLVLDTRDSSSSFTEYKSDTIKQDTASKGSFEAAYQVYLAAIKETNQG